MNKTQKGAWYGLFLAGMLLLVPVVDMFEAVVNPIVLRIFCYSLAVVMVLPCYFIYKKKSDKINEPDERDKLIIKRAILAAFCIVCVILLVAYTIVVFISNPKTLILVETLPVILYCAAIIFIVTLSLATLVQYRVRRKNGE